MPLNSVQVYVKGLLDGLPLPGQADPLEVWITPPVPGDAATPQAYVWGSTVQERRRTAPRGQGFKNIRYNLDIWLLVFDEVDPDQPRMFDSDSVFPLCIDAVRGALTTATMPVQITDAGTGVKSHIIEVGEEIDTDYAPIRSTDDQRYVMYEARLIVPIIEQVQG